MSQDLIKRYKKSIRVRFQSDEMETNYRQNEESHGRSSSVFAFSVLCIINLVFCYLEYRAFSIESSSIPMYGYFFLAMAALANALISQFYQKPNGQNLRLLGNGAPTMLFVMLAAYLQKYGIHHALEMSLLVIWLASLNSIRFLLSSIVSIIAILVFLLSLYVSEVSGFRILLASIFLFTAAVLGASLSYLLERQRRLLFLQTVNCESMISRQEFWAFTLIDLDIALSGILDFKDLIDLLKDHLKPVVRFDSCILTSLEGQGPKPAAYRKEGELFESEENTLWSEDLLNKLTQTRQATTSAEHEVVKGFLGMGRKKFTSYRLDVPVFNDSSLMGVVSLRRSNEAFDDLDMIASLSISSQAMLIYKRTLKNSVKVPENKAPENIAPEKLAPDPEERKPRQPVFPNKSSVIDPNQVLAREPPPETIADIQPADNTASSNEDEVMAPSDLVKRLREEEESTRKTITLLSRDNADKVAIDKYRSAAIDGEPLSILIIEVDGLSKLREQDGDQVAYKVFAAIVKYIFSNVDKEKDILGRYGQNGLSILMPLVDMNAAEKFAEKMRQYVERARYKTAYGEKNATLSIGVAAITNDTGDYGSMVKRADMALFVAKKNGRNCVKVRL